MAKRRKCSACGSLDAYTEVEDEPLPAAAQKLEPPGRNIAHAFYSFEKILACRECGQYFFYRKWNPGGSCDAFQTCTHESVSRWGLIRTILFLKKILPETEKNAREYEEEGLGDHYAKGVRGILAELKKMRSRAKEVVQEAKEWIRDKHADSDELLRVNKGKLPDYYPSDHLEEMRRKEQEAADRIAELRDEYAEHVTRK